MKGTSSNNNMSGTLQHPCPKRKSSTAEVMERLLGEIIGTGISTKYHPITEQRDNTPLVHQ
jgi:hypothetical protein